MYVEGYVRFGAEGMSEGKATMVYEREHPSPARVKSLTSAAIWSRSSKNLLSVHSTLPPSLPPSIPPNTGTQRGGHPSTHVRLLLLLLLHRFLLPHLPGASSSFKPPHLPLPGAQGPPPLCAFLHQALSFYAACAYPLSCISV